MKKRTYSKGIPIAKQGDRVEVAVMIVKGSLKIVQTRNKGAKKSASLTDNTSAPLTDNYSSDEIVVEIADLGCNDIFGIVEIMGNLKKMRTAAIASTPVEAFVVQ